MNFKEDFNKKLLFLDGAMGTILQAKGLPLGELPENWNITHPEVIKGIHKSYLDVGCNIISSNTFGANSLKFKNADQVITAGIEIAKQAILESGKEAFVACDVGPTGKLIQPLGELSFEKACEIYTQIAKAGAKAGADLFLIETMSDTMEIKAAVLSVKENTSLPVIVSMIFDENGRLLTGADIKSAVAMLEGLRVDGIGFNCGLGPKQMTELLDTLLECTSTPIIVTPNAGLPVSVNGHTHFNVDPEEFGKDMVAIASKGCSIIGGCCGTTPAHIATMIENCKNISVKQVTKKENTIVSSYSKYVEFGGKPVIIGERINPTGKARFKQALREGDVEYILKEGITQQEKGADVLDVNVGLPEINETEMMVTAVKSIQAVLDTPLQIDTSNIEAMEAALRIYNGKPLINSVNGKADNMKAVFPLVKKYGGVVVALTLDEDGIPETAEGRIAIAEKIIKTAGEYGIDKKDILIDTLCMTVSTGEESAKTTLNALRHIRNKMGVNTVLGVSNISFGLPQRELINSAFFILAMENGLSAGIINPVNDAMMRAYYSFCALKCFDPNCEKYIEQYSNTETITTPIESDAGKTSLKIAIIKGLKEDASRAATVMLQNTQPLDIINKHLVPALDVVGKGFENNTIFLPQLLMSAEAAKSAFEAIKSHLVSIGESSEKGEKIVLATVYGDIHDIGKNIVKVLLENYGFDVIDLGKDVPEDLIVKTVLEQNVKLVGLSALMTTTVSSMEATIKKLHDSDAQCKIMVGGAVLSEDYAKMINADFYGKDAMASVNFANAFFGKTID